MFLHGQQLKREPEDLSHHRKSPADLDGGIVKGARQKVLLVTPGGEDLVVDVVNNNIKDELGSPQHGGRSLNGTPTSTGSVLVEQPVELIAADGLKSTMSYSTQIFSPMANATHSGTPSPNPYNDHVGQYTSSSQGGISAGYITTSAGTIRGSSSSAFTVSDPYYREYFSGEQTYVRQQVPVYAESPDGVGGTISSGSSAFVDRYVRGQNSVYHGKGVIGAAGLTVDLPSPDSGIGADAVTPRDQTQMQQVMPLVLSRPLRADTHPITSDRPSEVARRDLAPVIRHIFKRCVFCRPSTTATCARREFSMTRGSPGDRSSPPGRVTADRVRGTTSAGRTTPIKYKYLKCKYLFPFFILSRGLIIIP